MSKPPIKEFQASEFMDGSVVFENDSQIKGHIEGGIELSDIVENRSTYNITVGPLYYGPDPKLVAGAYTHNPLDWKAAPVSILVWRAPRKFKINRLEAFIPDSDVMDELATFGGLLTVGPPVTLNDPLRTLDVTVQERDPLDSDGLVVKLEGAFGDATDTTWTDLQTLAEISSPGYTVRDVVSETEVAAGQYVRIMLKPTSEAMAVQCIVTVTMTVTEEHVE